MGLAEVSKEVRTKIQWLDNLDFDNVASVILLTCVEYSYWSIILQPPDNLGVKYRRKLSWVTSQALAMNSVLLVVQVPIRSYQKRETAAEGWLSFVSNSYSDKTMRFEVSSRLLKRSLAPRGFFLPSTNEMPFAIRHGDSPEKLA